MYKSSLNRIRLNLDQICLNTETFKSVKMETTEKITCLNSKKIDLHKQFCFRSLLLFFFLNVIQFSAFGQISKKAIRYNNYISKAEYNLSKLEFKKASKNYKQAFNVFNKLLSNDAQNALIVCSKSSDKKFALQIAYQLLDLGICKSYFSHLDLDKEILDSIQRIKPKKIDTRKMSVFESLLDADQDNRTVISRSELWTRDSLGLITFINTIQKLGFPSDFNIGIKCFRSDGGMYNSHNLAEILLIHYRRHNSKKLDSILLHAVNNLELNMFSYLKYCNSFTKEDKIDDLPVFMVNGKVYKNNYTPFELKSINHKRRKYGELSLQQYTDVFMFYLNEENSSNFRKGNKYVRIILPLSEAEVLKKNLIEIKKL